MFNEGARLVPVSEAIFVVNGIRPDHGKEGEDEEHEDQNDFESAEEGFRYSEKSDRDQVQESDKYCEYNNSAR